jgi:hypothetical protein
VAVHGRAGAGIMSSLQRSRVTRVIENGGALALCALIVYAVSASSFLVAADNAEFVTLGAIGGRAHPSGYPLYVLWLRVWSWLPGTPVHASALATAVLGALTVLVLQAACRAWGARPAAANLAVAVVAAAPLIVRYHAETEVFALNNLMAALVVWLAADHGPVRGARCAAALGLVAGLGLANHLTCVLVAPIGLYGVVRAVRESSARAVALAVLGLVVGLAPYAYLFVADGPASWGRVSTASELIATFLRREYGMTSLSSAGDAAWTASVAACLATIARAWLWVGALAGAAMLGVRIWRPVGASRAAWALLALSIVLAGPGLTSRFNIDPHGIGLFICQRFHLLATILLAVPVAAAIEAGLARVAAPRRPLAASGLAIVGFVALAFAAWPDVAREHSPAMELGVRNLVRSLPPRAIAVVLSEDQCFGAHYLQYVRGERPDVWVVCSALVARPWYRADWALRGLALPAQADAAFAEALLATGRPVLVDRALAPIVRGFPSYPFGVLYRVLASHAVPPPPSEVAVINRDVFRGFALDYPRPGRDDDFAAVAHRRYAAAWAAISSLLEAAGDHDGARDAYEVGRSLQPAQD